MSRTRRAVVAASFGYVQFALAMVSGIVLVPVTLYFLGARTYGLWLATGELLGYAGMVDLGVVGVLPWMLAEADGRRDRDAMRSLVANGFVVGVVIAVCYAAVALLLWSLLPSAIRFTANDRATIGPALALVVAAMTVSYPLRVFSAVVTGLQDVRFNGWVGLGQSLLGIVVTVGMLWAGYGVLALASAVAVRQVSSTGACVVRTLLLAPELLTQWPRPSLAQVRHLLTNGLGGWFGAFGWQLLTASNSLVIVRVGSPEWVPIYVCTARLSAMGAQLSWVIPDAGLVGLAQLHGETRTTERVRGVVLMMLRLHLLVSGAVLCAVLAFNPAFVTVWVGEEFFGGLPLHTLLAVGVVAYSLVHGLLAGAAVLGNRLQVGLVTLANGMVQVGLSLLLGLWIGLTGIAAAGLLAGLVIAVPAGVALLARSTALKLSLVWRELIRPWSRLAAPVAAAAGVVAIYSQSLPVVASVVCTLGVSVVYVWRMRPFYADLPFDARLSRWLVLFRLLADRPQPALAAEKP